MNSSRSIPTFLAITTALFIAATGSPTNAKFAKAELVGNLVEFRPNPTFYINNFDAQKTKYLTQAERDFVSEQLDSLFEKFKTGKRRREQGKRISNAIDN
jgi:hypothetical protein